MYPDFRLIGPARSYIYFESWLHSAWLYSSCTEDFKECVLHDLFFMEAAQELGVWFVWELRTLNSIGSCFQGHKCNSCPGSKSVWIDLISRVLIHTFLEAGCPCLSTNHQDVQAATNCMCFHCFWLWLGRLAKLDTSWGWKNCTSFMYVNCSFFKWQVTDRTINELIIQSTGSNQQGCTHVYIYTRIQSAEEDPRGVSDFRSILRVVRLCPTDCGNSRIPRSRPKHILWLAMPCNHFLFLVYTDCMGQRQGDQANRAAQYALKIKNVCVFPRAARLSDCHWLCRYPRVAGPSDCQWLCRCPRTDVLCYSNYDNRLQQ